MSSRPTLEILMGSKPPKAIYSRTNRTCRVPDLSQQVPPPSVSPWGGLDRWIVRLGSVQVRSVDELGSQTRGDVMVAFVAESNRGGQATGMRDHTRDRLLPGAPRNCWAIQVQDDGER